MHNRNLLNAAICLVSSLSVSAVGYAQQTPEERLQSLETQVKNQQRKMAALEQQAPSNSSKSAAFNPDISLILSGRFVDFSSGDTPSQQALLNGEEETLDAGFGLGESELIMSANIDQHFYGQLTLAIADEDGESEVELEEAFIQATMAPGLKAKAGRFLSGFGYQNEQHAHTWDLSIAPLAYRYLLGGSLGDDGLQMTYLLPTDVLVLVGGELLKGQHYPATANTEIGAWTAFLNVGADVGTRGSWLVGISHYDGKALARTIESESLAASDGSAFFSGDATIDSMEAVFKFAPTGNMKLQHFKLQAEYLWADDDGEWRVDSPDAFSGTSAYEAEKEGFYVQATYQWSAQWRTSVRYDHLEGELSADADADADADALATLGMTTPWEPEQTSAAVDWMPSEFSHVRVQYSHDKTDLDNGDLWLVEYTVSLGAHGAHRY